LPATSQYPLPLAVGAMATTPLGGGLPPVDPLKRAAPKEKTPPSLATIQ
jgi:hypothetical protein